MRKRFAVRSGCLILLLCILCSLVPAPARAEDWDEVDVSAYEQMLRSHLAEHLTLDLEPFYDARPRTATYANCAASYEALYALSALVSGQLLSCVEGASDKIEAITEAGRGWKAHAVVTYDWRTWASLYKRFRYELDETIAAHVQVRVVENEGIDIYLSLPEPEAVFASVSEAAVFSYWMDYSNLYTLYDDGARLLDYRMPELTPQYVGSLVFPLDEAYERNLKDTWYQSRSRGTRRHMGTDIKAGKKATIYSCSDGEVVAVGSNSVGGYYVAVRDDFGYLYLYFHMFKNTQKVAKGERVTAGQPIGLVGNTGNSTSNHLHLGIIAPDWTYVNAYTVLSHVLALRDMTPREIRPPGHPIG